MMSNMMSAVRFLALALALVLADRVVPVSTSDSERGVAGELGAVHSSALGHDGDQMH